MTPTGKSISVSCFVYVIVSCDAKLCAMIFGMLGFPELFSAAAAAPALAGAGCPPFWQTTASEKQWKTHENLEMPPRKG